MNLQDNLTWFFGIVAFVALFTGASFLFGAETSTEFEMISFSELSNADMDLILAVKDEMQVIKIQPY